MSTFRDFDRLTALAPNFKRRLSGVTSTIIQLVPEQARLGVSIATLAPKGALPDTLPRLRWRDLWRLWKRPADGLARVWHARRNIEMIAGVVMRDVLRMPLVLVFTSAAQRRHKALTRWLISRMDAVIATSEKSGSFLDVDHTVIMHGIDTERFRPAPDNSAAKSAIGLSVARVHIGCTGRIRHSKGTDLFVDAMIALLPDHPQWDAIITGRATSEHEHYKRDLENRIAAAGLGERIRFVGEVDDVVPWYQAFDLFVAPSRNEGFGLTPLEAMACGVPCVTSDAGAYEAMITPGESGICCPASDEPGLRRAIDEALTRTFDSDSVRLSVLESFSLQRESQAINRVYEGLRGAIRGQASRI